MDDETIDQTFEELQIQDMVYALVASPAFARDGVCFAARASGLFRSDDGGLTWHFQYVALDQNVPILTTAVAISPDFENDQAVFTGIKGGILRSSDGGKRWHVTALPTPPPLVSTLAISPNFSEDGTLLAGTLEDGVFCSTDRGVHWSAWNFGLLDMNILCMALSPNFAQDETVFVGTESGIFRSTNGGRAWRAVDFATEFAPVLSLAAGRTSGQGIVLFAGTEFQGLFSSADRGRTWIRLAEESITDAVNSIVLLPDFSTTTKLAAVSDTALQISHDAGYSWSSWQGNRSLDQGITAVALLPASDTEVALLISQTNGTILRRFW